MKRLIYFTIGNNIGYLKLLELCLSSIKKSGYDGDILFITNFEKEIRNTVSIDDSIRFFDIGTSNLLRSSSNKLKIYKYDGINQYDKIIFCDLDTIWLSSPNILFDSIQEDKVYMSTEHHQSLLMSFEYWGGNLLTHEERAYIDANGIIGLNAGFLGFNKSMLHVIEEIDRFYEENIDKVSSCLEQPYVNTYLFRHNLYSATVDKYISNNANNMSEEEFEKFEQNGGVLLHFSAEIGDVDYKYGNMLKCVDRSRIKIVNDRERLISSLPKGMKIMEIGVFKGEFSKFILTEAEPVELHLVDPFEGQMCSGDKDGNNIVWTDLAQEYESLTSFFAGDDRVFIHKGFSSEVLQSFEDGYFDMVYVDGEHSYEAVSKDLAISFDKVRPGGYICGHDYTKVMFEGVVRAVDEFCQERNRKIKYLTKDGCPTYLIVR